MKNSKEKIAHPMQTETISKVERLFGVEDDWFNDILLKFPKAIQ
jgi:hypothetical protein